MPRDPYQKLWLRAKLKAKEDCGDAAEELLTILSLHSTEFFPFLKPEERKQMNSIKVRIINRNNPYVDHNELELEREKYRQKTDEEEMENA